MSGEKYIVYRQDVCKIAEEFEIKNTKYYKLIPLADESLSIKVPVNNSFLRNLLTAKEVDDFICNIPAIDILNVSDKQLIMEYQKLLTTCNPADLIKIIKTTYLRNQNRSNNGKKVSEIDENYFQKAEKLLYLELSLVLGKTKDEVKEYIAQKLK